MPHVLYLPGSWFAIASASGVVMLPADAPTALTGHVGEALDTGRGLAGVLESLTAAYGTSLGDLPPFAVAILTGSEVRLAVRGSLAVEVTEAGPEVDAAAVSAPTPTPFTVSGVGITTWSERVVANAATLLIAAAPDAAADAAPTGSMWLGLRAGVVLADAVRIDLAAPPSRTPAPTPSEREPIQPASLAEVHADSPTPPGATPAVEPASPAEVHEQQPTPAGGTPTPTPAVSSTAAAGAPLADPTALDQRDVEATVSPESTPAGDSVLSATEIEPVQPTSVEDTRTDIPDEAYDHLWGETVVKSVESAAVRYLDDDDEDDSPDRGDAPTSAATPAAPPAPATTAATPEAPADWTAPPATGLIDRVPGFSTAIGAPAPTLGESRTSAPASAPATAVPAPAPTAASPTTAPPTTALPSDAITGPAADDIDHDGLTVTVTEVDAMRRLAGGTAVDDAPTAASEPAPSAPAAPARPTSHGTLRLSTGDTVALDRTVIVGRRPRANRVDADRLPTLVTVPSPEQDISRNHLEVRIEGRHVLAVDLATTNGSVLHRDGTPPARLTPNEAVLVLEGDLIDIGDGVTLTFEGLA